MVVLADWFVAKLMLDSWELVMFPLMARLTIVPFVVVAGTVAWVGAAEGFGVGVSKVGEAVGVGTGEGLGVGVAVDVGVGVGSGAKVPDIVVAPLTF